MIPDYLIKENVKVCECPLGYKWTAKPKEEKPVVNPGVNEVPLITRRRLLGDNDLIKSEPVIINIDVIEPTPKTTKMTDSGYCVEILCSA
jgi:hypothetical protein